jgi:transcriptional regulator with XRE-family HTH domain
MDIGEKIRELRIEKRMSQKELAEKMGLAVATISSYEVNNSQPNIEKLIHLSKLFGVSIDEIVGNSAQSNNYANNRHQDRLKTMKYYDLEASAGNNTMFETWSDSLCKEINVPGFSDCDFALNVWGDSMYPSLHNGSIAICKEWKQSFIEFGYIYLIITRENHRMIKYINPGSTPDTITCESENKFYQPFEIRRDEILKLYMVKGSIERSTI